MGGLVSSRCVCGGWVGLSVVGVSVVGGLVSSRCVCGGCVCL